MSDPTVRIASMPDLPARPVLFVYPDDADPCWTRRLPELACAANAVSLLMPHLEPYVVKAVRSTLPELDDDLRSAAGAYLRQEMQHHVQHRRFNDILVRRYPWLARIERLMRATFGWLWKRRSREFSLAFAAAFETVAFTSARWVDSRAESLFRDAEPVPAALFLWHLAEEAEHKRVAFDVYRATGGSQRKYVGAMAASVCILAFFVVLSTLTMLVAERRILRPIAHVRLLRWTLTFLFELLPALWFSAMRGHDPDDIPDPPVLTQWLRASDLRADDFATEYLPPLSRA